MSLQLIVTLVVVFLASCYLLRRGWKVWFTPKQACSGACDCGNSDRTDSKRESGPGLILLGKIDLRRDYPNQNI